MRKAIFLKAATLSAALILSLTSLTACLNGEEVEHTTKQATESTVASDTSTEKKTTKKDNTDNKKDSEDTTTKKKKKKKKTTEKPSQEETTEPSKPLNTPPASPEEVAIKESFSNCAFIGDSRTEGIILYTTIPDYADVYSKVGLNVTTALTDEFVPSGKKFVTIVKAMKKKKYDKIYISLGVNELKWPSEDVYYQNYQELINQIRAVQPDATIYVESIIHITTALSNSEPLMTNARVDMYNEHLQSMCNGSDIIYVELNPYFDDKNHGLIADSTTDGIHFKPQYYDIWVAALIEKTA